MFRFFQVTVFISWGLISSLSAQSAQSFLYGNDTLDHHSNCTNTVSSSGSSSSYDIRPVLIGAAVGSSFTFVFNKILTPLWDRFAPSPFHSCGRSIARGFYRCKSKISCCRGVCMPESSETMELNEVIQRPRKGWLCLRGDDAPLEESLHLLDRYLGNSKWEKSPIVGANFSLAGFHYDNGNVRIAIIREYDDVGLEAYELHESLRSSYLPQSEVDSLTQLIEGEGESRELKKRYLMLRSKGVRIMNDSSSSSSSSNTPAITPFMAHFEADFERANTPLAKAQVASNYFIEGLLLSSDNASKGKPAVKCIRRQLKQILESWKYKGIRVKLSNDLMHARLEASAPFVRFGNLRVYISRVNVPTVDEDATSPAALVRASSISLMPTKKQGKDAL